MQQRECMKRSQCHYHTLPGILAVFFGTGAMGQPIAGGMTEMVTVTDVGAEAERTATEVLLYEVIEENPVSHSDMTAEENGEILSPISDVAENRAACVAACASGPTATEAFCRVVPHPTVRAACWGVVFAGKAACAGFCYWYF
jgi:hypothetical protein